MDDVILKIDGKAFDGWEEISIKRGLASLCSSFSLALTEKWPNQVDRSPIKTGCACEIWIDAELIITGWIEEAPKKLSATDRSVKASGRDRSCDLVDCSAVHKPGSWKNQKLEKIARDLIAPFDLTLRVDAPTGASFASFVIEQGEDVHAALTRLCRQRGVMLKTDADSTVVIFTPSKTVLKASLEVGRNIIDIDTQNSAQERFSDYTVKGQCQGGDDTEAKDATSAKGTATDAGVTRYRPLIIISDEQATLKGLQTRAKWEATVRAAKSLNATVLVQGWRDDTGALWRPDVLVPVSADAVDIGGTLMISEANLSLSKAGRTTSLTLVRPESFTTQALPEAKSKKDKKGRSRAMDTMKVDHVEHYTP